MRRFSQRNALVTLSEINITPLLDLAFVLLIIFVITRPLLEQGMDLNLSPGGAADKAIDSRNVRTIEIDTQGRYKYGGRFMPLYEIETELVKAIKANPRIVVYIRADELSYNKYLFPIIDRCQKRGIRQFSFRTKSD